MRGILGNLVGSWRDTEALYQVASNKCLSTITVMYSDVESDAAILDMLSGVALKPPVIFNSRGFFDVSWYNESA